MLTGCRPILHESSYLRYRDDGYDLWDEYGRLQLPILVLMLNQSASSQDPYFLFVDRWFPFPVSDVYETAS